MSSLEMAGVSLTLFRLNDERLRLLDAPTTAPAWPNASKEAPSALEKRTIPLPSVAVSPSHQPVLSQTGRACRSAIETAAGELIRAQEHLTELDRVVGDGDLGLTLARGAAGVLEALPGYPVDDPAETLKALGRTLQRTLGGSSGPLYGVMFLRAGSVLKAKAIHDLTAWAEAIKEGIDALSKLGGAGAGDKTMLDALIPFAGTFRAAVGRGATLGDAFKASVSAAQKGAEATVQMKSRRGRSSYLGERTLGHPDPGAIAVTLWLGAVAASLR